MVRKSFIEWLQEISGEADKQRIIKLLQEDIPVQWVLPNPISMGIWCSNCGMPCNSCVCFYSR